MVYHDISYVIVGVSRELQTLGSSKAHAALHGHGSNQRDTTMKKIQADEALGQAESETVWAMQSLDVLDDYACPMPPKQTLFQSHCTASSCATADFA